MNNLSKVATVLADFLIALGVALPIQAGLTLLRGGHPWVAAFAFAYAYPCARIIVRQLLKG